MIQQKRKTQFLLGTLTGGGEVQIIPAGAQDSGIDSWDHVGLIHDEVHHIMVTVQLTLKRLWKASGLTLFCSPAV